MKYDKSTIKAPEQRESCCSGVLIFDFRGIFATQLKIYDGAFLWKQLTAKSQNIQLGSEYASEL